MVTTSRAPKPRRAATDWCGAAVWFLTTTVLLMLLRAWVVTPFVVPSGSMLPTLPLGTVIVADRVSEPHRGDIVVFHDVNGWTGSPRTVLVKRLVGVGNDVVSARDGVLYVNGQRIEAAYAQGASTDFTVVVPEETMFLMGDNRGVSYDSRCQLRGTDPSRAFVPTSARIGVVRSVGLDPGGRPDQQLASIPTSTERPAPHIDGGCG